MPTIQPKHKAIQAYYAALKEIAKHKVRNEGALEVAFQRLLTDTGRQHGWTLLSKQSHKNKNKTVIPDGELRDTFSLIRGFWEAKDADDDLDVEITKKIKAGYPLTNIIFEDTQNAALYQNGVEKFRADLTDPRQLSDLLNLFYAYTEPHIEDFETAIGDFKERVPDLAKALAAKIQDAHKSVKKFQSAFDAFFALCKQTLNPNISEAAVDEMLVQHLLTERLITKIFDNADFTRRNVIAAEVEKVIDALVSKSFNRHEFLKSLDRFYLAIEAAARTMEEFSDKQHFLNTVYERFFQGYSVKLADTHGIVYTPQPIVNFMCASVEEVLQKEFGKKLGDRGVNILDPCTGTGNFIVNLLHRIPKPDLPRMYREQLFANEVMLLPYYIAALNIEHAYFERTGNYESFEGLCFVDTLDLAEGEQGVLEFMTEANTARVERQKRTPITVIIGNPPYNVGQLNENDQNKNRQYKPIEERIQATYARSSSATNKNSLSDAYVKFFRWATDRLPPKGNGIVCFVSNNGFLTGIAFDGFRKQLAEDYDLIYHLDLKGNARTSGERRRREGGNIFSDQIRVGIGITVLVRHQNRNSLGLRYHVVPDYWNEQQKARHIASFQSLCQVPWQPLRPDNFNSWLTPENADEFAGLLCIGDRQSKTQKDHNPHTIFKSFSVGVKTNRDDVVYDFCREALVGRVQLFIDEFNSEVDRYRRKGGRMNVDDFVRYDKIKWSESLKANLARGRAAEFHEGRCRVSLYRPFCNRFLYFDEVLNERRYQFPQIFPTPNTEKENRVIVVPGIGNRKDFGCFAVSSIPALDFAFEKLQCFPFYVYDEDGSNRRENITDWALQQFRDHYGDKKITKWDIFHYVYGVLHHPGYREKFADNLKRELPRIPFAPPLTPDPSPRVRGEGSGFWAFAKAGEELARLHLDYEKLDPWKLELIEVEGKPLSYKVEDKMRLSKDKTQLIVNPSLTLAGIPPEVFQYRLGNRSALDWVIDQYRITEDKRSGIKSDPNREDDEEYIVRLVGQVVRVSVETVKIVKGLPKEYSK